jgi:hypothetical protein
MLYKAAGKIRKIPQVSVLKSKSMKQFGLKGIKMKPLVTTSKEQALIKVPYELTR